MSRDVLQVQQGSLYPALHRLEKRRWLRAEWAASETGRDARFYTLTPLGRKQLGEQRASWDRLSAAISGILSAAELDMWFKRRRDPRICDEIQFHRDRLIEDYMAAGMSRADAERRAFLEFGNVAATEERVKDVRGRWLEDFGRDIRYALRALGRSRGFTAVAVLALALGIGANTAIFSVINAVVFKPIQVEDPGRLVSVFQQESRNPQNFRMHSYPDFLDIRASQDLFEDVRPVWCERARGSEGSRVESGVEHGDLGAARRDAIAVAPWHAFDEAVQPESPEVVRHGACRIRVGVACLELRDVLA
jgi:DNA-binding PadR family transcriptional regulator